MNDFWLKDFLDNLDSDLRSLKITTLAETVDTEIDPEIRNSELR